MPNPSRRKGDRREREIVALHQAAGIQARRVPLSGSVNGYPGDVVIELPGRTLTAEVKARGSGDGFRILERWLGDNDLLFLRRDRAEPLVLLPWRTWQRLIGTGDPRATLGNPDAS